MHRSVSSATRSTTASAEGGGNTDNNNNANNEVEVVSSWENLTEFSTSYTPRKDAGVVAVDHGKVLVTGGTGNNNNNNNNNSALASVELVEWNVRRSWKLPSLTTARFGHATVALEGHVFVLGGADEETNILGSVEQFSFQTKNKKVWTESTEALSEPRLYATAVAVPQEKAILVMGGRDACFQELDSMEVGILDIRKNGNTSEGSMTWNTLRHTLPSPRFGCAAVVLDPDGSATSTTKLLVMGGYDGRQWQTDCYMCDINMSNMETGSWNDMPPLLQPVRFGKVVTYYNFVLLLGEETEASSGENSNSATNNCSSSCLQCFDTKQRQWIWCKRLSVPLEDMALQEPHLYGFTKNGSTGAEDNSTATISGIVACELAKLDYKMVSDSMAVAVGTVAAEDSDLIDAPTIIAMDPVVVADDQHPQNGTGNQHYQQQIQYSQSDLSHQLNQSQSSFNSSIMVDMPDDKGLTLRSVTRIMLPSEKSFYTGQLRKKDGSWVPHGEGLEVWVDSKENDPHNPEPKHSYYKGRFVDGYRHGLGEMYLRLEDKHYFGQFKYGSWDGIGTLKLKSRGFSYFGQFVAGEMTGLGRCSYRILKGNNQWVQRTYAGTFLKGMANGLGAISNFGTGKIEEYREYDEEDVFHLGSHGGQVSPMDGGSAIDC